MVTVIGSRRRLGPAKVLVLAAVSMFVLAEPPAPGPAASKPALLERPSAATYSVGANHATVTRSATAVSTQTRTMRTLINNTRVSFRRAGLRLNARLSTVAQRHSARMAKTDRLHHNPNLVRDVGDMPWKILGENVGVGATVQTLHKAFMNSPSHRDNILRRSYRLVGIGVLHSGGRTWVTVVFYG